MAATIHELKGSRSSDESRDSQTFTVEYFIRDVYDTAEADADQLARQLVYDTIGVVAYGLLLNRVTVTPLGGGCFLASVEYSSWMPTVNPGTGPDPSPPPPGTPPPPQPPPPPPAPGEYDPIPSGFSFSLSAVTEKITQSKETVSATGRSGGTAPNTERAIGVTADGKVEGVDAIMPMFEWSVTRQFEYITLNYLKALRSTVGTVNGGVFYSWEAYTTLFLGAEGNSQNNGPVNITFKFRSGKNEENISICDSLTVPAKRAHDYLWVMYESVDDATSNVLVQQPMAAYVERIYDEQNFGILKIGT